MNENEKTNGIREDRKPVSSPNEGELEQASGGSSLRYYVEEFKCPQCQTLDYYSTTAGTKSEFPGLDCPKCGAFMQSTGKHWFE